MLSICTIEECSFRAWPALTDQNYDGWVLRFADGYTQRANSVNPMYSSTSDVNEKITYCETLYAQNGLPSCFRLVEGATYPPDLATVLERRGYVLSPPTCVYLLDLTQAPPLSNYKSYDLHHDSQLTDAWLTDYLRLDHKHESHLSVMRQTLNRIQPAKNFIALRQDAKTMAVGLGVCDGDYVGLFMIVTDTQYRRRGYGEAVVVALLDWGKAKYAKQAYLQVEKGNAPALALYEKIGFRETYQYCYWKKTIINSA